MAGNGLVGTGITIGHRWADLIGRTARMPHRLCALRPRAAARQPAGRSTVKRPCAGFEKCSAAPLAALSIRSPILVTAPLRGKKLSLGHGAGDPRQTDACRDGPALCVVAVQAIPETDPRCVAGIAGAAARESLLMTHSGPPLHTRDHGFRNFYTGHAVSLAHERKRPDSVASRLFVVSRCQTGRF